MAAKVFEVGDVLPQRYITIYRDSSTDSPNISIKSDSNNFNFIYYSSPSWYYINGKRTFMYGISSTIVNLSSLSVEKRTISSVSDNIFSWEDSFVNYKSLEKTDIFPPAIIRFRNFQGGFAYTANGYELYTDGGSFTLATGGEDEDTYLNGVKFDSSSFLDVDMTNWSLSKRTIAYSNYPGPDGGPGGDSIGVWHAFYWEALPPSYSITFEENGGSTVTDLTEQTALPSPLPTPTKSGYTFLGWYYDSSFTQKATAGDELTADVTLYAKWELTTYTITYNTNGGSSVPQTSNATQLPTPLPTTTKASHVFAGWYYDNLFTQKAVAGDELTTNVTLYAKWELNTYTITYNSNGGSSVSQTSNATQLPSPLPTTTKANHAFAGWYYDDLFTQKAVAGDELTANVTLYAKWYTPTTWCEDIADAIREKEGSSGNIKHVDFPERILAISGGGVLLGGSY